MIEASCHCGNVKLKFKQLPDTFTVCNCSICSRYGVKWIYFSSGEVKVVEKKPTNQYVWGDKCIAFHHCSVCGCITHYSSLPNAGMDRVAVNANLLEDCNLVDNLKIRKFDGANIY